MRVYCLEFRDRTVNVNVIVIVNLQSVAINLLIHIELVYDGDTSAETFTFQHSTLLFPAASDLRFNVNRLPVIVSLCNIYMAKLK